MIITCVVPTLLFGGLTATAPTGWILKLQLAGGVIGQADGIIAGLAITAYEPANTFGIIAFVVASVLSTACSAQVSSA